MQSNDTNTMSNISTMSDTMLCNHENKLIAEYANTQQTMFARTMNRPNNNRSKISNPTLLFDTLKYVPCDRFVTQFRGNDGINIENEIDTKSFGPRTNSNGIRCQMTSNGDVKCCFDKPQMFGNITKPKNTML